MKSKPAVRGAIGASGLDRAGILRLWSRIVARLEEAGDALLSRRSL